jgi:TonB-dependent SusC/RagA subfamily outer membrane receptor
MKIKVLFFVLLSFLCICSISAQKSNKKITITGTVTDAAKGPISNAIIMIDGVKTNSLTDEKGYYKIKVKPDALKVGIFTFGNGIKEEVIAGRTEINFTFGTLSNQQPDLNTKPGDVATDVGYGAIKKRDLTKQVTKIEGTDNKYASYTSITDLIQRNVSGARISGSSVILQDSKDLFGSVPALIIVDGVYMNDIPDIQPINVKSIEVLKGPAAAMYGSRGYGGVIIIKTKIQN